MAAGREEKQQHDLLGGVGEAPCQQSRQTVGPCRSLCSSSVLKVEGHFDFKWLSVIVSSDTTVPSRARVHMWLFAGSPSGQVRHLGHLRAVIPPVCRCHQEWGQQFCQNAIQDTVNGKALGFLSRAKPQESPSRQQQC